MNTNYFRFDSAGHIGTPPAFLWNSLVRNIASGNFINIAWVILGGKLTGFIKYLIHSCNHQPTHFPDNYFFFVKMFWGQIKSPYFIMVLLH